MSTIFVVAIILCVVSQGYAKYKCDVPGNSLGEPCVSQETVVGKPGHQIMYSVTVPGTGKGTKVCCRGYSPPVGNYVRIGCGYAQGNGETNFSKSVDWGNHTAKPSIRCQGNPYGTTIRWSHHNLHHG